MRVPQKGKSCRVEIFCSKNKEEQFLGIFVGLKKNIAQLNNRTNKKNFPANTGNKFNVDNCVK